MEETPLANSTDIDLPNVTETLESSIAGINNHELETIWKAAGRTVWNILFEVSDYIYFRELLGGGILIGFIIGFITGRLTKRRRGPRRGIGLEPNDRIVSVRELEILQRKAEVAADAADSAKEHGEEMERRLRVLLSPVKTNSVERRRRRGAPLAEEPIVPRKGRRIKD